MISEETVALELLMSCRRLIMGCLILVGLSLCVGAPLTVVAGRALESQPTFCASCHEEKINYDTWLASGAARDHPTCIECHSGPGIPGVLHAQARGAIHIVKHFTGTFQEPLRGSVPREWCTQCHTPNPRLDREHRRVTNFATRPCAECHHHRPEADFKGED